MGEAEASNAGEQLARNRPLETHPDDEPGAVQRAAPVYSNLGSHIRRIDLLNALKNSSLVPVGFPLSQLSPLRVQTRPEIGSRERNVDECRCNVSFRQACARDRASGYFARSDNTTP